MVVGDENGYVGVGYGKAVEILDVIRKVIEDVKKYFIEVLIVGIIILYEVIGDFGVLKVLIKFVLEGIGVIVGGVVRVVCEFVGIKDIRIKSFGFNNFVNVVYVIIEVLK